MMNDLDALDYGKMKARRAVSTLARELRFTEAYQHAAHLHPYLREVACLRVQTHEILLPIADDDLFAGRIDRMFVGIDPERGGLTDAAYFCQQDMLRELLQAPDVSPALVRDVQYLLDFWRDEVTHARCREAFPPLLRQGLPSDAYYLAEEASYPMYGLGGSCLDYHKLLTSGIPGLRQMVDARRQESERNGEENSAFYSSLLIGLDIVCEAALHYAAQAREKAATTTDLSRRACLTRMATSLEQICLHPPQSYYEAIQLFWLYALIALPRNYGRMDVYLGDFLSRDLDAGVLTEEEAFVLTRGLWRLIIARGDNFNNRIMIGGKGRPNPDEADRFALLALRVQQDCGETIPQLSLRWHDGMNPELWRRSFAVIAGGSTFPILYNDDVTVSAVQQALNVDEAAAVDYMAYGCGEIVLDHQSVGSPDGALNLLKVLDITLHNGVDNFTGRTMGLSLGTLADFPTFDSLQSAFAKQVEHQIQMLASAQETIYAVTGRYAAYPLLSLLYDDCVARGKPLLAGGVRYLGGTLETFGNNSCADALLAIKTAIYDERTLTAQSLMDCLQRNFAGYERERRYLAGLPKFGNDDADADAMSLWVNQLAGGLAQRQTTRTSLDSFNIVLVNNGDSVLLGKATAASADGRQAGEPLSNGNQPSAGFDRHGPTALLNSMAKLDPSTHAGATHNLKISRMMITQWREELAQLIRGYFNQGGSQVMITVTDAQELEQALVHPEQYQHLIVRVGGYSERFILLPEDIQREVLRRTLYVQV